MKALQTKLFAPVFSLLLGACGGALDNTSSPPSSGVPSALPIGTLHDDQVIYDESISAHDKRELNISALELNARSVAPLDNVRDQNSAILIHLNCSVVLSGLMAAVNAQDYLAGIFIKVAIPDIDGNPSDAILLNEPLQNYLDSLRGEPSSFSINVNDEFYAPPLVRQLVVTLINNATGKVYDSSLVDVPLPLDRRLF